jgi:hypothetical protein
MLNTPKKTTKDTPTAVNELMVMNLVRRMLLLRKSVLLEK